MTQGYLQEERGRALFRRDLRENNSPTLRPHLTSTASFGARAVLNASYIAFHKQQCNPASDDRVRLTKYGVLGRTGRRLMGAVRQSRAGVCTMTKSHFSYVQARTFTLCPCYSCASASASFALPTTIMLSFLIIRGVRRPSYCDHQDSLQSEVAGRRYPCHESAHRLRKA